MYCWVTVDPPPVPPCSWFHAARAMPVMSNPGLEKNERSSAARTANWTCSGTWSRVTLTRLTLSGRTVASGLPSAKVNVATCVTAASSAEGTSKIIQPIANASAGPITASATSAYRPRRTRRQMGGTPSLRAPAASFPPRRAPASARSWVSSAGSARPWCGRGGPEDWPAR
jgi:hypothetical protein